MNVNASVNYHIKSETRQAFHFEVDGIEGNIVAPELDAMVVEVEDLRDDINTVSFAKDGIIFKHVPTTVRHFTGNNTWQATYDAEIQQLLKREIGAKDVLVFDHTVRIDDQNALRKPARNVHNDYSKDGAEKRLADLIGEDKAQAYKGKHYAFVNVWRPIEMPISSSPLGFILPSSMDANDWMLIDLVYPERRGEILGVSFNPQHQWFYQSDMRPDEVAIFNIFDNRGRPYLAHSALDLVDQAATSAPRKSIETRTLVTY